MTPRAVPFAPLAPFLPILAALSLSACALAFTSGAGQSPAPEKFLDTDRSAAREELKKEEATGTSTASSPTFGMSLVIGAPPMDAGGLPKPPFPVVMLH